MAKFANTHVRPTAAIKSAHKVGDYTYNGGKGYSRDAKSELFILAVNNFVGEDTFYESGKERDQRYVDLVRQVTQEDPGFIQRMLPWLRNTANMRTAPFVAAAEYTVAGGRDAASVIASSMARADEPAEFLGYWHQFYGKNLPRDVRTGLCRAINKLYDESAALRYNSAEHAIRMADVIEMVHPRPKNAWQEQLFGYLLDQRHHDDGFARLQRKQLETGELLKRINRYHRALQIPQDQRRARLAEGAEALTWEQISAWLGKGGMDKAAWEAMIPHMGYMALLRNLRNFDDAGVSDELAEKVCSILTNPVRVQESKQFPLRFYSAYSHTDSLRWATALDKALRLSIDNVPSLKGRTLILVDASGSMYGTKLSARSTLDYATAAALFGLALALRAENPTLISYSTVAAEVDVRKSFSVLKGIDMMLHWPGAGQCTATLQTLAHNYNGHDRVVIVTDEQADPSRASLPKCPIYTISLVGYKNGHLDSGSNGHYTFSGLSDQVFQAIPLLEAHRNGGFPF